MRGSTLTTVAAVTFFALAPSPARGGEVSTELRAAFARLGAPLPILVTLRAEAVSARRAAAAPVDLAVPGFTPGRRLENAPVVSGVATPGAALALAAREDVLHVGLDRLVRPAGQVGIAQIGADHLYSVGVTGVGRSVAVVDSGIDLQHPDLKRPGGGAWPGADIPDGTDDLADCNGHGTEVAGVLAGPQGIVPGAGLVILKVFSARDGCKTARASDVLAAIDWAVTHAPGTDLDAINLSLADDTPRSGFCDTEDPAGAAVFAAARTAGLAVVAAAGNDGKTAGLPWPACMTSVASIGMVYSQSSGPIVWGGAASCTDLSTGPDVIPCASNSGSALSMLAPGVDWTTTASGGGQTSGFSGTSAAAPAAAGAFVLTRQARPLADPFLSADLLRASGVPVRDPRTDRTTPRLDLGAALAASSLVPGGCAGATIPDGAPDGLACDAVVSSLVGTVSSVTLALTIDHPDPRQLVVTLTGPDGTSAVVMNRSGRAGEAVREVFGLTAPSVEPLSSFAGRPAPGTWRLHVIDTVPGGAGRLVAWSLAIEPTAPVDPVPFPGATSYVATAVHHFGKNGSFFTTDVRLFNADAAAARTVTLRFAPAGEDLAPPTTLAVTIPPLATRALDDVIRNAFRSDGYGPLLLNAAPSVVAATRTATTAPRGGSFGLGVAADPVASAGPAGSTLVLVPCFKATGFRVNVGITEVSGQPATVDIVVRDSAGALKAVIPRSVPAGSLVQLNDLYGTAHILPASSDRLEVRVTGSGGRIAAWATPVDDVTNDGAFVAARPAAASVLIPAAARAAGAFGSRFVTDLKVSNAGASPVRVLVSFSPTSAGPFAPALITLAGSETRMIEDVLGTLFAPTGDVSGALLVTALDSGAIYASTRTSTAAGAGSYGLAIEGASAGSQAAPGRQLALTFLSSSDVHRTNVGFVETGGAATHLRATLLAPDGTRAATRDFSLAAYQAVQWDDVFAQMQAAPLADASLLVDVLDGGGAVAYAILVDNRTNDASYFPAALVPAAAP